MRPMGWKAQYRCVILVSHPDHIVQHGPMDDDTLILSSDWLLAHKAVGDVVHVEALVLERSNEADGDRAVVLDNQDGRIRLHGVSLLRHICRVLSVGVITKRV